MRRSLKAAASAAGLSGVAVVVVAFPRIFTWATSAVATASVFSRSKERTFCGLLSSRTVKSSAFRVRTKFPSLSRTVVNSM